MQFKEIKISKIFDILGEDSKLTKTFIENNKGDFPVYSGETKNKDAYGYINFHKYEEKILIRTTYGDAGKLKIVEGKLNIGRNASGLRVKSEYREFIHVEYIKYLCEIYFKLNAQGGKGELRKLPQQRVRDIYIKLPIKENGKLDLEKQKEIALQYEKIEKIKDRLRIMKEDIENKNIQIDTKNTKSIKLNNIFDIKKGLAKYTKTYINQNSGEYVVYSSQTTNDGTIGTINTFDYDEECLTRTTDGIYAGTVFYRSGRFSMTTHCGGLFLKKTYRGKVDLKYLYFYLNRHLKQFAFGTDNKRVTTEIIKNIDIEIPIKENGEFDLEKQKEIAFKYEKLEKVQQTLIEEFEYLEKVKVEI